MPSTHDPFVNELIEKIEGWFHDDQRYPSPRMTAPGRCGGNALSHRGCVPDRARLRSGQSLFRDRTRPLTTGVEIDATPDSAGIHQDE